MRNKGLYLASAAAGAVVGVVIGYFVTRKGVDNKVVKEVEQVKQAYARKEVPKEEKKEEAPVMPMDGFTKKYNTVDKTMSKPKEKKRSPERISPNEFGDEEEYECITLLYYKDGILAYDNDEIIDDPDDIVGEDFYKYFGEFDDGTVYVRNDREKRYYEICENELYYDTAVKQSRRGDADD